MIKQKNIGERGSEIVRNVTAALAVGSMITGLLLPGLREALYAGAAVNVSGAVAAETARRHYEGKRRQQA